MKIKSIYVLLTCILLNTPFVADEKTLENNTELSFYTGMFDFSDDGQRAALFGFQHQNENLVRDSFLGTLSPVTGFMVTEKY